ncbi:MAG: DinB family protein [Thermoanaerobaculia bacterium]
MPHKNTPDPRIALLANQLRMAFDRGSWHGTNLLGALRRVSAEVAVWRPQPTRHNIAELALHAAYWKYRVCRILSDETPRTFDLPGSNFFPRDAPFTPAAWKADVELLKKWHSLLLELVEGFDPQLFPDTAKGGKFTYVELILGASSHDLYHTGQIQLIRKLRG